MKVILLFLLFFIGWIFPPVFLPASLTTMGVLIAQGFPTVLLVLIVSLGIVTGYLPMWWLVGKIFYKKERPKEHTTNKRTFFRKIYGSVHEIVHTAHNSKQFKILTEYLETKTGKIILFCLMVLLCTPIFSNIIAVLILRKRISLKRMILIASIGETIGAIALVYGGIIVKWITQLVIQTF